MAVDPGDLAHEGSKKKSYRWLPNLEGITQNTDWDRDLIEHSLDLLCIHDLEGNLLSVNPRPAQLLGYTVEELLRIPIRQLIAPKFQPAFDEYLRAIVRDGEASGLVAVQTRTGEQRIWEYHNTLRMQGVPSPLVRGMAHDVTDRIRIEKTLQELVKRLSKLALGQAATLRELRTVSDSARQLKRRH